MLQKSHPVWFFITILSLASLAFFAAPEVAASGEASLKERILVYMAKGRPVPVRLLDGLREEGAPARLFAPRDASARGVASALRAVVESDADESSLAALREADARQRARFDEMAEILERHAIGDEIRARYEAARVAYEADMDVVLARLAPFKDVGLGDVLKSEIEELLAQPDPPILRALLPYRRRNLAPRVPEIDETITPSYARPDSGPGGGADLVSTLESPLSEEILDKAAELDHEPVAIYEFVRNEIVREWTSGVRQDAAGTLRRKAGNSTEQSALLIALLRASKIPARFVHGVIELPLEAVAPDFGIDPEDVPDALARAGVAYRPVVRGGSLAAVEVEHTWITTWIPYGNYRGAVIDLSGKSWIALAPAIKRSEHVASTAVLREMSLDVDSFVDERLATAQSDDLLADLRARVEQHLSQARPSETYEEQLGSTTIAGRYLGLLPAEPPMKVVGVTDETPEIGARALRHGTPTRVRAGPSATSPILMEGELPLAQRRVTSGHAFLHARHDRRSPHGARLRRTGPRAAGARAGTPGGQGRRPHRAHGRIDGARACAPSRN